MQIAGSERAGTDTFRRKRGDVQSTGAGSGVVHSDQNEHKHQLCQFRNYGRTACILCIIMEPFGGREEGRAVVIASPLKGGKEVSNEQETTAERVVEGQITSQSQSM